MTVSLAIRVYVDGTLESEKQLSATPAELEELLPKLATEHARRESSSASRRVGTAPCALCRAAIWRRKADFFDFGFGFTV